MAPQGLPHPSDVGRTRHLRRRICRVARKGKRGRRIPAEGGRRRSVGPGDGGCGSGSGSATRPACPRRSRDAGSGRRPSSSPRRSGAGWPPCRPRAACACRPSASTAPNTGRGCSGPATRSPPAGGAVRGWNPAAFRGRRGWRGALSRALSAGIPDGWCAGTGTAGCEARYAGCPIRTSRPPVRMRGLGSARRTGART